MAENALARFDLAQLRVSATDRKWPATYDDGSQSDYYYHHRVHNNNSLGRKRLLEVSSVHWLGVQIQNN